MLRESNCPAFWMVVPTSTNCMFKTACLKSQWGNRVPRNLIRLSPHNSLPRQALIEQCRCVGTCTFAMVAANYVEDQTYIPIYENWSEVGSLKDTTYVPCGPGEKKRTLDYPSRGESNHQCLSRSSRSSFIVPWSKVREPPHAVEPQHAKSHPRKELYM